MMLFSFSSLPYLFSEPSQTIEGSEAPFNKPRGFGLVLKYTREQGLALSAPLSGHVMVIQARPVVR
jgi:hypothetical protein